MQIKFPPQDELDTHLWISATGPWYTVYDRLTAAGVVVNKLSLADVRTLKESHGIPIRPELQ